MYSGDVSVDDGGGHRLDFLASEHIPEEVLPAVRHYGQVNYIYKVGRGD